MDLRRWMVRGGAGLLMAIVAGAARDVRAQHLTGPDGLVERVNPFRFDPSRPLTVAELCKRLDFLAEQLRDDGLVVIKQPDVFSQARLTRFRIDFDREFQKDLDQFQLVLAARINRLDAATTTQTTTLGAALTSGTSVNTTPANMGAGSSLTNSQTAFGTIGLNTGNQKIAGLGVEPTVYLDEKRRFLEHLNEIRRISLGPDQNDSSGYGLYLIRMPVSLTPGECTYQGHGADLSVTMEHELTPDLLPATFQNLVVNDLVDVLGPFIYEILRTGQLDALKKFADRADQNVVRAGLIDNLVENFNSDLATNARAFYAAPPQPGACELVRKNFQEKAVDPLMTFILRADPIPIYVGSQVTLNHLLSERILTVTEAWKAQRGLSGVKGSQVSTAIEELEREAQRVKQGYRLPNRLEESLHRHLEEVLSHSLTQVSFDPETGSANCLDLNVRGMLSRLFEFALPDDVAVLVKVLYDPIPKTDGRLDLARSVAKMSEELGDPEFLARLGANLPNSRNPKQIYPLTSRELLFFFGAENIYAMAKDVYDARVTATIRSTDVRAYLRQSLTYAYYVLARSTGPDKGVPPLGDVEMMDEIFAALQRRQFKEPPEAWSTLTGLNQKLTDRLVELRDNIKGKTTAAYCWAAAVDAALLDRAFHRDIHRVFRDKGIPDEMVDEVRFYLPREVPNDVAKSVFNDYVKARWPIVTFALDPVSDQQNIADSFNLKRDLQLALAYSFATGQVSFNQVNTFRRQLEQQSDTIALNRTVSAYAHGNDAFGFRFSPRFQNPPNQRTNIGVIASQLVGGGPGPDYGIRHSKLEPGIRELTAIVLLPTFLPTMRINVAGNWYKLHDPEHLIFHTGRALEQGRRVQELRQAVVDGCSLQRYRGDDLRVLQSKLGQLEGMLPMQSKVVQVPFENTADGYELFSEGATALVPELSGFEGIDQYDPNQSAEVFLYGKYFNILDTKVIAGGRLVQSADLSTRSGSTTTETSATAGAPPVVPASGVGTMDVLSREVIRIQIPSGALATTTKENPAKQYLEIYVATPNGISNRVLIPFKSAAPATPAAADPAYDLAGDKPKLDVFYQWIKPDGEDPRLIATSDPGESLGITWTNSTGLAPRSLRARFTGVVEGKLLSVTTDADSGTTGDYKVDARSLTVGVLRRLQQMYGDGNPLPASVAMTVEVLPYAPTATMGYRVETKSKTLPKKLQVNLFLQATGRNALPGVAAPDDSASAAPGVRSPEGPEVVLASLASQAPALLTPPSLPAIPFPSAIPTDATQAARVVQMLTGQAVAPLPAAASPTAAPTPGPTIPPPAPPAQAVAVPAIIVNPPPQSIVVTSPKGDKKHEKKSRFHPSRLFGRGD
ncbi:hypothetical protein [Paludisphaera mucosa]|uniref:Uncharacterized protein n=1 Tax=Paludisphaera mucosa TaxID=3030827 RepID=A0ABT6F4H1_9BACT|nr:hypothetical protein [Paludisphaera mucosa]MDG3002414.1 hypothetical protein [Paludisphaera mucosa]